MQLFQNTAEQIEAAMKNFDSSSDPQASAALPEVVELLKAELTSISRRVTLLENNPH